MQVFRPAVLLAVAASVAAAGCAPGSSSQQGQIAELNHLFATVDPLTADAIENSQFLRQFANLEVRTTTGTSATWTGRYLYGRRTYVEFFAPRDFAIGGKPAPVGAWGLALSGDRLGSNKHLQERLEASGHKVEAGVDTRKFGDRAVPWFRYLTAVSSNGDSGALDANVSVWAMEYVPSYFDLPEAAKEPAEGPDDVVSRERYQSDAFASRMMRDITFAHFHLGPADFARIEPMLTAAGYRIRRTAGQILADGEEADLHFTLSKPAAQGLREVRFQLNRPVPSRTEFIGRSVLVVGPSDKATWSFQSPAP